MTFSILFLLGLLGAVLTVYLAKEEVVPEFHPLFDTDEKKKEKTEHQDHIKRTEEEIDEMQAKLRDESLSEHSAHLLTVALETSQTELNSERVRLQTLESDIKQSQVLSRSLGFLFYIVLGGAFGALLAGKVQVEGLSGDLPKYFESILIGATWTTYLSTIGFRSGQSKADDRIEAALKESAEQINALKKDTTQLVSEEIAKAEKSEKVEKPVYAGKVAELVAKKFDVAAMGIQKNLNLTRQMVQSDMKGIL